MKGVGRMSGPKIISRILLLTERVIFDILIIELSVGRTDVMSVPDRSIDPRLLSAAKDEFLKKGFDKTSLTTTFIQS